MTGGDLDRMYWWLTITPLPPFWPQEDMPIYHQNTVDEWVALAFQETVESCLNPNLLCASQRRKCLISQISSSL